jgi:hypothetical protein
VGISPIFNIADLYPYREDGTRGPEYQKDIVGKVDACSRKSIDGEDHRSANW